MQKSWPASEITDDLVRFLRTRTMAGVPHIGLVGPAPDSDDTVDDVFDSDIISLSREHSDFKWVDYDSACSYLVWRGQKKGIYIVNEMIISNDDRMKWSQIDLT